MSIKQVSYKHILLFSIISLFLLFLSEGILVYHVTKHNNQLTTIIQEKNTHVAPLNGIYGKLFLYHSCINENNTTDAFYELKITNNTQSDFYNWKVEIPLTSEINILKSLNANTSITNDNILTLTPYSDDNNIIRADSVAYIEVFLSHDLPLDYKKIIITGNTIRHIGSFPLHKIIVVLGSIIIIFTIIYSLVYNYMKREIEVLNRITRRSYAIIDQTMKTFVNFIDAKDQYTRGHSTRVAEYSKAIAKRMGYDEQFQQDIYYMGLMHDIGKITIPDTILNKTSHLTADEWAVIQLHTQNGANLLKNFTIIPEIRDAVLYHHERYDGKGYLAELKGEEIPLCARIICVADSYDAMNTNRCYRLKYSKERIIKEFERCSARQFDPTIASIMIELISDGTV